MFSDDELHEADLIADLAKIQYLTRPISLLELADHLTKIREEQNK